MSLGDTATLFRQHGYTLVDLADGYTYCKALPVEFGPSAKVAIRSQLDLDEPCLVFLDENEPCLVSLDLGGTQAVKTEPRPNVLKAIALGDAWFAECLAAGPEAGADATPAP